MSILYIFLATFVGERVWVFFFFKSQSFIKLVSCTYKYIYTKKKNPRKTQIAFTKVFFARLQDSILSSRDFGTGILVGVGTETDTSATFPFTIEAQVNSYLDSLFTLSLFANLFSEVLLC